MVDKQIGFLFLFLDIRMCLYRQSHGLPGEHRSRRGDHCGVSVGRRKLILSTGLPMQFCGDNKDNKNAHKRKDERERKHMCLRFAITGLTRAFSIQALFEHVVIPSKPDLLCF